MENQDSCTRQRLSTFVGLASKDFASLFLTRQNASVQKLGSGFCSCTGSTSFERT